MSQKQYLKVVEKEIQKINQKIDLKIIRGEDYKKEARDHKIMIRRMKYLKRGNPIKSFFRKISPSFSLSF